MDARCAGGAAGPTVLVSTTTWWPSVAVLAGSLERAGFSVVLLCPPGHVGHQARHFRCRVLDRARPVESLAQAIRDVSPLMVMPGDDRAVAHLIRLAGSPDPDLRAATVRSLGPASSHPVLTDRAALLRAAEEAGLAVPAYRALADEADLDRWLRSVPAPWVLKADGAWGGEGVAITQDREAAARAFQVLARGPSPATALWRAWINGDPFWLQDRREQTRRKVSAQRFIQGRPGTCALFARDGEMLGATLVEAGATYVARGPSTLLQAVERPDFLAGARRLVRNLRLSGFVGLDFMVEEATGRAMLIEMNPRITTPARMRGPFGPDPISAAAEALGCGASRALPRPRDLFAAFPLAWLTDPFAPELARCAEDCPWHEPLLLRAALEPLWPERGPLAALPSRLRALRSLGARVSAPADYRAKPFDWWIEENLLQPPDPATRLSLNRALEGGRRRAMPKPRRSLKPETVRPGHEPATTDRRS